MALHSVTHITSPLKFSPKISTLAKKDLLVLIFWIISTGDVIYRHALRKPLLLCYFAIRATGETPAFFSVAAARHFPWPGAKEADANENGEVGDGPCPALGVGGLTRDLWRRRGPLE